MDPHLEIRKLLPSQVKELAIILEYHEQWKCFMSVIPKDLGRDFVCDISIHNPPKYNSEHFRCGFDMDPHLEIRKLLPSQVKELAIILEYHEQWKCFMSVIPKDLGRDFVCDISIHNPPKYNSEHFRLIEYASDKWKIPCTEILFEEWGTSGRIRPTLGHLLHLLMKSKLFRAADYVAVNLLHQPRPERPEMGPEAMISVDIPTPVTDNLDRNETESESHSDLIPYFNMLISGIENTSKLQNC